MKTTLFLFLCGLVASGPAQTPRLVVPVGHISGINAVAFSPDGKYVLTGSQDKTAKLWDMDGREIQTFSGHVQWVLSVAFSPDGKTVLTGSEDKMAKLWDLKGKEILTFKGHTDKINSVAFSANGKMVLTGSDDGTTKLWDLDGQEIQTLRGHTSKIRSVAFSPDGKYVLTGDGDETARLWNLNGKEIQIFTGHLSDINAVAFSPDGNTVLTGSGDYTAKLWDLNGREIQTLKNNDKSTVRSVAFSPDGKTILIGYGDYFGKNSTAKLWNLNGREVQTFKGHTDWIESVAFSPDGKTVLTGSGDGTAKLWNLSSKEIQTFKGHASMVLSIAFSPDRKAALTGNSDHTAKLWSLNDMGIQTFRGHVGPINAVTFSPAYPDDPTGGKTVLTGSMDKTAKLWHLNGREIQIFKGHTTPIWSVAFSPDNKSVLTCAGDKTIKFWNLNGREIQTFSMNTADFTAKAFSPDGKMVLTAGRDHIAELRSLEGQELQTFAGHKSFITSVAFSPNGQQVLTGSYDKTAKLWDLQGWELQTFSGHGVSVELVAFSPGGQQVLTVGLDNTAKLWDIKTGRTLQTFTGHAHSVTSIAFSPDGQKILTGSRDNTTKLWSTATGEELASLIAIDSVDWVVTTPSGLFDASSGAMKLMHYVQDMEVIELDQLKERYYEPGLLAKIMCVNKEALRNVINLDNVALYPEIKAGINKNQLTIELTERNGGLGKLSLFINGKEVQEDINPKRLKVVVIDLNTFAKYYRSDAENKIALFAYNAEGWLKSQAYALAYSIAKTKNQENASVITSKPPALIKPSFYALVVGTANYAGEHLDLRFADLDAEAMAAVLKNIAGQLFGLERTTVHLLSSAGNGAGISSKSNIRQAFEDIAARALPADVLVVYFSGHGLAYGPAEKEQFYYLTKDIGSEDLSDPVVRDNFTISTNEFTQWLTAIPTQKQVMIFDACNAGKVVESLTAIQKELSPSQIRALDRMKNRTGMFILTGAAADKVSYEASQYGQGLLTYSLLQGISGLALTEDKRVDVMTLFQFVLDQVPELAKGIGGVQTPVLAFPAGGASFDIGIVNTGVKIPVAQVKPVFIRNNFKNEVSFADDLKLADALAHYFQEITAKGTQAEIIYIDVQEYENAYSVKGLYKINEEAVAVRGRLFKGKESLGEFEITGERSNVNGLVIAMMEKVSKMIK